VKAPVANEAGMTNESAKTQVAEQFLTGFRSRDWALWKSIMQAGVVWSLLAPEITKKTKGLPGKNA